jgi:NodT family efflux transporter outer membrane factor (OMF) lipoprotein
VRIRNKRTLLAVLLIALSGCKTVGPKFVKPAVNVNQDWSFQSDARIGKGTAPDAAWWHAFNDPTLDKLIDLAYHQNLPLQISGLRIMESRAQLAVAVGAKWPQVQELFAGANAVGISNDSANVRGFDRYFVDYQVGFDAAWEIDFWGKYKNLETAEASHYVATVGDYDTALVTLSAEVARNYALVRTFEALIALAQQNIAIQEEGVRIAQSRFKNGATSELDVSQATTLLENTRSTIPQLEIRQRQSENALATLIGQPPGTVQDLLRASKGIPSPPTEVAVSMPTELLRRRPDIRGAEFAAMEQSAREGIATADLYPSFSLVGTLGLAGASATGAGGLSAFYVIGPRINLPIFDYGRRRNQIRIEDARLQQLLVGYQQTVLAAEQEVEDGLTGYLKSRDAATFAENAATSAQRSTDISFVQYREGAVDFQRVLDAMRTLLAQQNTLTQTRSDIATNLISLYKALGGGWEIRNDHPFISDTIRKEMENRTNWSDLLATPPPTPLPTENSNTESREVPNHE